MVGVGAKGARRTLIAIRTVRDPLISPAARSGTQNSASETHFRVRRPRPVVPAESTPQTISFRANALNSRGIVGAGNPGRFAPTSWWS
jgi:hypothetical protein